MPDRDVDELSRTGQPERVAYSMRALGKAGLPREFTLNGTTYRLARTVKHDFFAATAFYKDDSGRAAVLKASRTGDFAGIPLLWLGRWLCDREAFFLETLAGVAGIPRLYSRHGSSGLVREYVPGVNLREFQKKAAPSTKPPWM